MLCAELEKLIGYTFHDKELIKTAMTHSSYANDYLGNSRLCNERLEFLGDAFLDAVVGEMLYRRFPDEDEGILTKMRADIVCEKSLGTAALKMGINEALLLSKGEEQRGGKKKLSIASDFVEAIIAAIYLDSPKEQALDNVKAFVERILGETINLAASGKLHIDAKTTLQERCQAKGLTDIKYEIIAESGPDHNKTFTARVYVMNKALGEGSGKTKKEAEGVAAEAALKGMEE